MLLLKIFVSLLFFLINEHVKAQDEFQSPCPRLFVYEGRNPNETDRWYGIVTLLSETDLQGVWLRMVFDRPSLQLGNWFGEVKTTDNKEYLVKNRNVQLKAHVPQTIRFYLKYNPNEPPPKLVTFRLNARTQCPEGLATESPPPTMQLHISNVLEGDSAPTPRPMSGNTGGSNSGGGGGGGGGGSRPSGGGGLPWNQGAFSGQDVFPGDFNLFNNRPIDPVDDTDLNAICGTVITKFRTKRQTYRYYYYTYPEYQNNQYPNQYQYQNQYSNYYNNMAKNEDRFVSYVRKLIQPSPLISYGQATKEGEYPWHAALYHVRGIDLAYICGASLVSKYHVLTVAHCVTLRRSQTPLRPADLVVYLGKYYLKRFSSSGIQDRTVSEIIPHPQYNPQSYSNDIAMIKLTNPADITDNVRPVCLWQENPDLSTVLHKDGSVVGWGFDETGKVTEQLMKAKMPVVSQETCVFSFPDFYSRFTSNNTYCAGFRNGTSVCNGDSGGGMVFPMPNSNRHNVRWQLRGLVSISVALQNRFKCDASHYVVFTDSAKYLDWIRKVMSK